MKVNRQNLTENYNTTVDWVNDFKKGLTKESDYLDNLKGILEKRKDFSSIEEKMADIKARAGFDLLKTIDENKADHRKSAGGCASCGDGECKCSDCSCGKTSCKPCRGVIAKGFMSILKHLKKRQESLREDDDERGINSILSYCRNPANNLGFNRVESVIDIKDIKQIISDYLGLSKNFKQNFGLDEVEYIPEDFDASEAEDGDLADYMRHAQPSG